MKKIIRSYSDLRRLQTFEERFEYLRLAGIVGKDTFGFDRYLNQRFYRSAEWKRVRDQIIVRDCGCDLGVPGYEINDHIYIHHMNPIAVDDICDVTDYLLNPEYLISTSRSTHNAIHYGDISTARPTLVVRTKNDTCPWKHD